MKSIIAAGLLLGCAHGAIAGPYANVETNSALFGDDYLGSVTEAHAGFEGELGESGSWYVQAGPAFVSVDGEDLETEFSGKVGAAYDISEDVNIYAEYSWIGGEELGSGVKTGVTYRF